MAQKSGIVEVDHRGVALDLGQQQGRVAAQEPIDDPAVLAQPRRVANLDDDMLGAGDDLTGDRRVEFAFGFVAGAAGGRPLGGHGSDRVGVHAAQCLDEIGE